ncbi:PIG-P-domain-containing protein [Westerdykella ornata]|uniref:PIG-P-domain-containing protein n=1 Tax=Westerdykella ornata TaxID=318751 RepID=A0A6A6J9E4_WESOR|nr:PIG-P-domain-containing protein [Westerdykella ornata]KAF2273191.1 PIG-P-domain-containing protein [Westerdykella ornata]
MPPKSRGSPVPPGFQSKSTPNLPTVHSLRASEVASGRHAPNKPTDSSSILKPAPIPTRRGEPKSQEKHVLEHTSNSDSDEQNHNPRPLHPSRSHSLFPPFYNRPPNPLPPSPSLTSLLRPTFTTTRTPTPSHSTYTSTPDSSDADLPPTTPTNSTSTTTLANLGASAPPIPPRASPKVPTYEYYGFALYLASSLAFLLYLVWAYVPSPLLSQMGIHYYPNRWWALAVPCWLVVWVLWIYVALASYNTGYLTLPVGSVECLTDECAQVAVVDARTGRIVRKARGGGGGEEQRRAVEDEVARYRFGAGEDVDWRALWSMGTDAVLDVPIGGVCEVLYGSGRDLHEGIEDD